MNILGFALLFAACLVAPGHPTTVACTERADVAAHGGATADAPEWNQWRGPKRDGLSPDTGLLRQWPASGPSLAWKATGLGGGYSGVSFSGDRVFTMGELDGKNKLIALNLSDGKIVWTAEVGPTGNNRGPGPRSTPATDGKLVYALGQFGDFICADASSGSVRWRKDLKSFGGRVPGWHYSESPLLDGDRVVVTPGGEQGAVLCMNKTTGDTVWQSKELTDGAHYTSLVPTEIGGVPQYLLLTARSVAGIAVKDGKLLWRADRIGRTAVCTTPVYRDGILFVTSAYGVGCNAFRITAAGGAFKAEEIYAGKQMENHHGGVILLDDHVYATDNSSLKCIELKTGKVVWENRCVGKGSVAYADGLLFVRSESGPIALVEATPTAYKELGRFNQPDRSRERSWPHPVVFGGRLYIRDQDVLLCYDVKSRTP